ncbi:MAG: zinc ribbon domain-containing protein [Caldilineales bacterium]|nr:zinc ribbon domain-containing protein [Caldilineales bacterium]MCW5859853.1 zinc ribbon domain-containing protein [Caldilineales bacterium]
MQLQGRTKAGDGLDHSIRAVLVQLRPSLLLSGSIAPPSRLPMGLRRWHTPAILLIETCLLAMPLYDYECARCGAHFTHLWRTMQAAQTHEPPICPSCSGGPTRRLVSRVAVLGELGGLTPSEQSAENRQAEKMASILPKETIDKFRAGRGEGGGGGGRVPGSVVRGAYEE